MSGKERDGHADSQSSCLRTNARMSPIILLMQIQQQPNYEHELCIHSPLSKELIQLVTLFSLHRTSPLGRFSATNGA